jgi:predicted nucleic acid-binding protein
MTKWLLDGGVLAALAIREHVHHERSRVWLGHELEQGSTYCTCPATEAAMLRLHMILAPDKSVAAAQRALQAVGAGPEHEIWLNNFSHADVPLDHLQGHRQLADAWLVELARRRGGRLATLDVSTVTLYPDDAFLVPVLP